MSGSIGRTGRGFPIWADFHDRYNAHVRVITSSSAEQDQVWIFTDGGFTESNNGAMLLTADQAMTLIDALHKWMRSVL